MSIVTANEMLFIHEVCDYLTDVSHYVMDAVIVW